MMNRIKALIKDDCGAVAADMVTLTGLVATLSFVLFASVQQDVAGHLAKLQTALTAPIILD